MIQNTIAGLETLLEDKNLRTEYRKKPAPLWTEKALTGLRRR